MDKSPTDSLSLENKDELSTTSHWVKFNDENGTKTEAGSEVLSSNDVVEPSPPKTSSPDRNPVISDQNLHPAEPAVIETSVAIVPTVQIQSPSKVAVTTSRTNVMSTSSTVDSISSSNTSNQTNNNNSKKDKPSTFINISNLDNIELRNSQSSLHATGASTSGHNVNGRDAGPRRSGFMNGDEIASIHPMNTRWPWVTPAVFRPELIPEEIIADSLTLTVEEFVHIMEMLTTDFRFNLYIICYKRLLASWLATAFFVLIIILFSGIGGIGLFALGITWLIINAMAVFLCMYIKIKINKGLERCMARVNKLLLKHKIIVGVDDRGRLSCHKIQLCFMYFDSTECIKRLGQVLDSTNDRSRLQRHLDIPDVDIVITGQNLRRLPQSQTGERLFLRYVQRWSKDYLRRRLDWTPEGAENPASPRHLTSALCPCQYTEEYLRHKPVTQNDSCTWWMPCCPQAQAERS